MGLEHLDPDELMGSDIGFYWQVDFIILSFISFL